MDYRTSTQDAQAVRRYVMTDPWHPGKPGKGIVTPTGQILAWATDDWDGLPFHAHVIRALGYDGGRYSDVKGAFTVTPDGDLDLVGGSDVYNYDPDYNWEPQTTADALRTRIEAHLARLAAKAAANADPAPFQAVGSLTYDAATDDSLA